MEYHILHLGNHIGQVQAQSVDDANEQAQAVFGPSVSCEPKEEKDDTPMLTSS